MTARIPDENGWYEVKGNPISKVGVFGYSGAMIDPSGEMGLDPDETYMVYRSAKELSDPDTIDSFKLLPWIDDHEILGEGPGLTPPEQKGVDGTTGEDVYFDDGFLRANVKMFSSTLADKIDDGKSELSCGYRCEYTAEEGMFGDEKYSFVQKNIRGNHLASVDEGRMGPEVAVLDHFTIDLQEFKAMAKPAVVTLDELLKTPEGRKKALRLVVSAFDAEEEGEETKDGKTVDAEEEEEKKKAEDAKHDEEMMKAAKDEEEEKEKMAKDEEEEKEKMAKDEGKEDKIPGSKGVTDSATLDSLQAEMKSLRAGQGAQFKGFLRAVRKRDALYEKVSAVVGVFDHVEMTADEVAQYGCKKLNLKPRKGHEVSMLDGYFARPQQPAVFAQDRRLLGGDTGEVSAIANYFSGAPESA